MTSFFCTRLRTVGAVAVSLLLGAATPLAAQIAPASYTDNFQSYGTQKNPPGWVDTSIGSSKPTAGGLYKTWPDPLQGNKGPNVVFGTKQSSGKPEATNNPRIGTFSTYTSKTFSGSGRFVYSGRFIRTNSDSRVGFTFFSSYPETDSYYLLGTWTQPSTGKLTMQLFAFGGGAPTGIVDSNFTPEPNKWYAFVLQAEDIGGKTQIRARFWLDTNTEPTTWSIEATDAAAGRLTSGRLGIWSAVKGEVYVDDLAASSPVDHNGPTISVLEKNVALTEGKRFNYAPVLIIKAVDDVTANPAITAKLDGADYTSGTAVTGQGNHTIFARAVDGVGNAAEITLHFYVDTLGPAVIVRSPDRDSITASDVTISVQADDPTPPIVTTATLNGQSWPLTQVISEQREHLLAITVTDGLGNATVVPPIRFTIDKTAPVATLKANGQPLVTDDKIFGENVLITLGVDDAGATKTILVDGSSYIEGTPITTDGEHRVSASAVDAVGNRTNVPERKFIIDKTPPQFVVLGNGQPMKRYYGNDNVALTIQIVDDTATTIVAHLNTDTFNSFPRTVSEEKKYVLDVTVTDQLGHSKSLDQPMEFYIDRSKPNVAIFGNGQPIPANKIYPDDVLLTITVDDLTPTTRTITLDQDTVDLPRSVGTETPRPHSVSAVVSDVLGHTTNIDPIPFTVDKTPPNVTVRDGADGPVITDGQFFHGPVHPYIDATDETGVTIHAKLGNADFTSGTAVTGDQEWIVSGTVTDGAGHTAPIGPVRFIIDTIPPVGVFKEGTAAFPDGQTVARDVSARVATTDAWPVVTVIHLDGRSEPYIPDTPITEDALHTLTATMTDAAGNSADVPPVSVRIDRTPPPVTVTADGEVFPPNFAFHKDITIDVETGQDASPIADRWLVINPGNHRVTRPYVHTEEGTFTVTGFAVDAAGNEGHNGPISFTLEKTPPTVVISIDGVEAVPNKVYGADVRITFATPDGITSRTILPTIDGQPYTAGSLYTLESSLDHPHVIGGRVTTGSGLEGAIGPMPFVLDKTPPSVTVKNRTADFPPSGHFFNADVVPVATCEDTITRCTVSLTLDGAAWTNNTAVTVEKPNHGSYVLVVTATDEAGNSKSLDPLEFVIDKTPPAVTFTFPAGHSIRTLPELIARGTTDDAITLQVNGTLATLDTAAKTFVTQTLPLTEGENTLTAVGLDQAGNAGTATVSVTVDTRAPQVSIRTPAPRACISSTDLTVAGVVSDPAVQTVAVTLAGQSVANALAADGAWTATFTNLAEGPQTISVEAKDSLGHRTALSLPVLIDRGTPVLEILESGVPFTGGLLNRPVALTIRVRDLDPAITAIATYRNAPYVSGTPIAVDGSHQVDVVATDCAGHQAAAPVAFTIDRIPPAFNALTPANGALVDARPQTLSGNVTDQYGVVRVELEGTSIQTVPAANGDFTLPGVAIAEGANSFPLLAVDRAGNVTRLLWRFTVQSEPPTVAIYEDGALLPDGKIFSRPVVLTFLPSDPAATVAAKLDTFTYNGAPVLDDGEHVIEATATDQLNHSGTSRRTFFIDRTPPVIRITSPAAGAVDADHVDVRGTAGDAASVTVNGVPATIAADKTFLATAVPLELGENLLVATGADAIGNNGRDEISVTYGGVGPGLIITSPPDALLTNRPRVDVMGRVLSPALDNVVTVGSKTAAVDGANAFRLNDYQLAEGDNVITVRATGLNHKEAVASVTVIGDFTPPALNVLAGGQPLADDAQFPSAIAISITATDNRPGVVSELSIDGVARSTAQAVSISDRGGHVLTAIARDRAGNETRVDRTFFIGATATSGACSITSTDPDANSVITSQTVTIAGIAPGAASVTVAGVEAQLADGTFVATIGLPQEGANLIPIRCSAGPGLGSGSLDLPLIRATGAPTVDITSPAEGFVSGVTPIEVRGTVSAGVAEVYINGGKVETLNGTFFLPKMALAPGLNIIAATATNAAGRTASDSVRGLYLSEEPLLTITSPLTDFQTGAPAIDVSGSWTDLDPSTLAISVTGATLETVKLSDTDGSYRFRNVPLSAGRQTLTVTGRSFLNKVVSSSVEVTRTANSAWIAIASPADNAYLPGALPIAVDGTYAATGARIDVNGTAATLTPDTPPPAAPALPTGTYAASTNFSTSGTTTPIVARLTDAGGNVAYASVRVHQLVGQFLVREAFPAAGAQEVHPGVIVLVSFTHPVDLTTLDGITLTGSNGTTVTGRKYVQGSVVSIAPTALLQPGVTYTIHADTSVKNAAGQPLAADFTSAFTVAASGGTTAPTVDDITVTCGQPILIKGTASPGARVLMESGSFRVNGTADAEGKFSIVFPPAGQTGWQVVRVSTVGGDGSASPVAEKTFLIDCSGPRVVSAAFDRNTNELTVLFSKEVKASTLTVSPGGSVLLVTAEGTGVSGTATVTGNSVRVVPAESLSESTFTLTVTTAVTDLGGARLVALFTQTFNFGTGIPVPRDGDGYISGEIYDGTNGRPLRTAQVSISVPATAFARTPSATSSDGRSMTLGNPVTSSSTARGARLAATATPQISVNGSADARGRYTLIVPEGAHTIEVTAPSYTTVWRQIIVPAGAGIVPIDIRLTQRGETKDAGTALALRDGGTNDVAPLVNASIPATALQPASRIALTSVGAQSLAGLLPLGWSPLASAELAVFDTNGLLQREATLAGAQLSFTLPDLGTSGQTLSLVHYDSDRDEWRTVTAVLAKGADDKWSSAITVSGAYAVVYPDRAAGLTPPPNATAGTPLQGVTATCGTTTEPCELTKLAFDVDPKYVTPTQSSVATLQIAGTGDAKFPSGTAVQAYVTETLNLPGGGTVLDAPFATDVLLYRTLDGREGVAKFQIAPSAKAAQYIIKDGVDQIQILHYPGRLDRGTLIGTEGGRVPGDDSASVEIPSGATLVELKASSIGLTAAERNAYAPIEGFEIVGGFSLAIETSVPRERTDHDGDGVLEPLTPVELARPARVTVTVDAASLPHPDAQLLLAEVLEDTPWTRIVRLAVPMTAIDPPQSGAAALRYTTRAIDPTDLPVDGVSHEGRFLVLAAKTDLAWATGTLRLGATGPYVRGGRIGSILPDARELGVRDVTRESGLFAVPVAAQPANPNWSIVPRAQQAGSGKPVQSVQPATRDQVIKLGDVVLDAQPPVIESVQPAAGDHDVDASIPLVVRIDFNMPIDATSAAAAVTLTNQTSNTAVYGDVAVVNDVVTFRPKQPIIAGATYRVTVAGTLRGTNGVPFDRSFSSVFSTKAVIPNAEMHLDRIHIKMPTAQGTSVIYGEPGAVSGQRIEGKPWIALPVRLGTDFVERYQAEVRTDGSFEMVVGGGPDISDRVTIADIIELQLVNPTGNVAALVRLTPFVTADGLGFVAPVGVETNFTSVEGVQVTIPAGTFTEATLVTVALQDSAPAFAAVPDIDKDMRLQKAVKIDFVGTARQRIDISLPLAVGAPRDVIYLLGMLYQSSRGPRVALIDTLRIENDRLTTALAETSSGARRVSANASSSAANDPTAKSCMVSLTSSGIFAPLDLRVPVGSSLGFAIISEIAESVEILQEQYRSLTVPDFTFTRRKNCVAIPVLSDMPFTITGVDALTGLEIFKKVYPAIPITDPGVSFAIENPNPDRTGPYPIYAVPFRVESLRMSTDKYTSKGYELTMNTAGTALTFTANPSGTTAKDKLKKQTLVRIYDVTKSTISADRFVSDTETLTFAMAVDRYDDLIVYVGEDEVPPETSMNVVFSEPIDVGLIPPGTTDAVRDNLVDTYLRPRLELKLLQDVLTTDLTTQARFSTDSQNRRLIITMPASLVRGGRYRLVLKSALGDPSGNKLGEHKDGNGSPYGNGGTVDFSFEWTVRSNADQLLGQFQLKVSDTFSQGMLRDLAKSGNLAFVAANDGGVLAYDLSDPGALNPNPTTGAQPLPISFVPTRWAPGTAGFDEHWSVAADQHGRIYSGGLMPSFAAIRSYRVEDFIEARDNQSAGCGPDVPAHTNCKFVGATVVSWRPGYSSALPMSTFLTFGNQAESYPRKIELLEQDNTQRYVGISGAGSLDTAVDFELENLADVAGEEGLHTADLKFNVYDSLYGSEDYLSQRITVINTDLDLRWSVDIYAGESATIRDILVRDTDRVLVARNRITYGLITMFGQGVGVFDLNAIDSNDVKFRCYEPAFASAHASACATAGARNDKLERIMTTDATAQASCTPFSLPAGGIPHLNFTPTAHAIIPPKPTPSGGTTYDEMKIFGLDNQRGVLDMKLALPTEADTTPDSCVTRGAKGLIFRDRPLNYTHPRLVTIQNTVAAAGRSARFTDAAIFHWEITANDNARGLRGSMPGTAVSRDYLLVAGNAYGLLIVEVGGIQPPNATYDDLQDENLVDVIWVPAGAVAVRTIPNSTLVTILDGKGRILLADLANIDQRWAAPTAPGVPTSLISGVPFPITQTAMSAAGVAGEVGVDDPRIVFKSSYIFSSRALAPLVDPNTGIAFGGDLVTTDMKVAAVLDPTVEIMVDTGKGLQPSGGVVPLGVEQPIKDPALPITDPDRLYRAGALSSFRVRVSLPGSIARSLPGQRLDLAVESERIYGSDTEQTPLGLPRAHLRRTDRAGIADPRPIDFTLRWAIPSGSTPAEQEAFARKYRHQSGYNRLLSPWIVAIADPRASQHVQGTVTEKTAAGCIACERPAALKDKTETVDKVYEFLTKGRFIAVRPGNISTTSPYAYLNDQGRMEARVPTTIADTVREKSVIVAAQNPPVAAGMLQETTYVHSGEVEINATDMVVAGRADVDIPLARTHRSRTIGGTVLGLGWEAPYLRRLRPLPNGKIEYRDGVGEIWTFEPEQINPTFIGPVPQTTIDVQIGTRVKYKSPAGLFLKLVRHANGWIMFDQQWRISSFDNFGRLVSDADEFWTPNDATKGNVVQYAYDSDGRLSQIIDPVGRITKLKYWKSTDTNSATCFALGNRVNPCTYPGLLGEIEDWRLRKVTFEYDQYGRMIGTQLPAVKPPTVSPAPVVPIVDYSVATKRPRIEYTYQTVDVPQAVEAFPSQRYTDFMLLSGNVESIFDPQEELNAHRARVKFTYGFTPATGMDRVRHQDWPCANWDGTNCGQKTASFEYEPITNPTSTKATDILGQVRRYQWGEKDDKRIHISAETVEAVPVMKKAYPTLPTTIEHDETTDTQDLVTTYNDYDEEGLFELVTLPSLIRRHYTAVAAPNGAPGKLGTVIWEELGGLERFTSFLYDTDSNPSVRPNSAATLKAVKRTQGGVDVTHDAQSPSRERKIVQSLDADAKVANETTYDDQGRRTDSEQRENDGTGAAVSGTLVATQHMTYNADDSTATDIDRGRLKKVDSGGGLETTVTYAATTSGGQMVTVRDEKRRVTTVTKFDSWDRVIERTVTDDTYGVLASEKSAFDATGRMVYSSRLQEGAGLVEAFTDYDVNGRVVKTRATGNTILDSPNKTLEQTSKYNLSATPATIIETDPHVEGEAPNAQVTSTLDKLGRSSRIERRSLTASSGSGAASSTSVVQITAYDVHGQPVYESDGVRRAALRRNDAFGREISSVTTDGQRTETNWSGWDQPVESKNLGSGGATVSHVKQFYTRGGRLRATNELVDFSTPLFPGRARQMRNAWDEGGKRTSVRIGAVPNIDVVNPTGATEMRITETTLDSDGRVAKEEYGTGNGISGPISNILHSRVFSQFTGSVAEMIVDTEPLRPGAAVTRTRTVDGADRIRTTTDGGYVTTLDYDEAGNIQTVTPPGSVGVTTATYDARGLMLTQVKSAGTVKRQYDALGRLRLYKDEDDKETTYATDDLGRVTSIGYPDGTTEEIRYDDAGQVSARRDRTSTWFAYSYDDGGSLTAIDLGETPNPSQRIKVVEYDDAKRITRVANKDAAVTYSLYDMLGRPRITKSIRYATGTGLADAADRLILDEHTQRHEWSVFDGERSQWTMPVIGDPNAVQNAAPWRTTITENWDAASNLISQAEGASAMTSTVTAGVGRIESRTRALTGGTLSTSYDFADTVVSAPGGFAFPQLQTGLLRRTATSFNTGDPLAGSNVYRDASRRIGQVDDLGLADRVSSWTYDGGGRLSTTKLLDARPDHGSSVPTTDVIGIDDFREQRQVNPVLSATDHADLADPALAYTIEPLSWKGTDTGAHAMATFTPVFDGADQTEATFINEGGRRKSNGAWTYEYDQLERLTVRQSDSRRIEYTYDPRGRVVGRAAFQGAPGAWTVETRGPILARDGLPARTTWVWDPVNDRLLAMYIEGASTPGGSTPPDPSAGLVRQYIHGDRGYDDPVEVLIASTAGATPRRFYPILDEAGSGSLQAVVGADGNLAERVLYADAFGDAPRYLQGPIVDRITYAATKDSSGNIEKVDIRLHVSEKLRSDTVVIGARLAAVKSNGDLVLTAADPELEGDATLHWELGPVEWTALSTASGAEKLEIAVTNNLRAEGWGNVPVQKAPDWAGKLKGVESDDLFPVRLSRTFANVATLRADGEEEVLYEIRSLYMAASTESNTQLLTDFHGYPFREPADGTIYVRSRWYDAATGAFLTPDPMGYRDSSNQYAFAANDPVNLSDPTGEILPVLAYLGSVVVNTAVDVAIDYAWHKGTDWWDGTDTEFDWHDSLQTNFSVNLVTGGFGSKISKLKYLKRLSPFGRKAVAIGAEYAFDVAATGTIDMLYHDQSAAEAYGTAAIGGAIGRGVGHGLGYVSSRLARNITPDAPGLGLFRRSKNIGAFGALEVPMQMRSVRDVAQRAGVGLEGVKIRIDRNRELIGTNFLGHTPRRGNTIVLYPEAFRTEEILAVTLGHERTHVYQIRTFGRPDGSDIGVLFEDAAYGTEDMWLSFFRRGGR